MLLQQQTYGRDVVGRSYESTIKEVADEELRVNNLAVSYQLLAKNWKKLNLDMKTLKVFVCVKVI